MNDTPKRGRAAAAVLFSLIVASLLGFGGNLLGMYFCGYFGQSRNSGDDTSVYLCGLILGLAMALGGGSWSLWKFWPRSSPNAKISDLISGHRWMLILFAIAIGSISLFIFSITVQNAYLEYFVYPKEKAADGYSYPQLRYAFFDALLLLWCLDGFAASGLSLWCAISKRSIEGWTYRSIAIYLVLFAATIMAGLLMIAARSRGM